MVVDPFAMEEGPRGGGFVTMAGLWYSGRGGGGGVVAAAPEFGRLLWLLFCICCCCSAALSMDSIAGDWTRSKISSKSVVPAGFSVRVALSVLASKGFRRRL